MITKNNLIDMLRKSFTNEDEFILNYAESLLKDVAESPDLNDDQKKEIDGLFRAVIADTERHRNTIDRIIEEVERGEKNEF